MSTRITAFRSACIAGATLILSLVAASARGPADEPGHDGLGESVAALMAAWGTDDVRWDLNADGIVDAKDLEMLLAPPADRPRAAVRLIYPEAVNPVHAGPFDGDPAWTEPKLVSTNVITAPNQGVIQVYLPRWNLGPSSRLVITAVANGDVQTFDARSLEDWHGASAVFPGNAVEVRLFVGPGDTDVHYSAGVLRHDPELIDRLVDELVPTDLCGSDNRTTSTDWRVGRLNLGACTGGTCSGSGVTGIVGFGTVWMTSNGALCTAGHVVDTNADGVQDLPVGAVAEFVINGSACDGTPQPSAAANQYPIDFTSLAGNFNNGGLGADWAVFEVNPNANTNLLPHHAYGFIRTSRATPSVGTTVRVTGCGKDCTPAGSAGGCQCTPCANACNAQSRTLQTSTGAYDGETSGAGSIYHEYSVDTMAGNSGSPILWTPSGGQVSIGIHTNGGCADGGSNIGTSFEHNPLENSLEDFPANNCVFVDKGMPMIATPDGSVFRPYETIADGLADVTDGGCVSVVTGNYGETFVINGTIGFEIIAPVGSVVIGN
jgi:hypothetical protein